MMTRMKMSEKIGTVTLLLAVASAALLAACGGTAGPENEDLTGSYGGDYVAVDVERLNHTVAELTGTTCAAAPCPGASEKVALKRVTSKQPSIAKVERTGDSSFDLLPEATGTVDIEVVTRGSGYATWTYQIREIARSELGQMPNAEFDTVKEGETYRLFHRTFDSEDNRLISPGVRTWTAEPADAIEVVSQERAGEVVEFKILDASEAIVLKDDAGETLFEFSVE